MKPLLASSRLLFLVVLSSCASAPVRLQVSDAKLLGTDKPRVQVPFSVPGPGLYDVVLYYFITDTGAGYDALGQVSGTAVVTSGGRVIQQSALPRRGKRSELFTDTNGLVLLRLQSPAARKYVLRLNITSVPRHLELHGAGVIIFKLGDTRARK